MKKLSLTRETLRQLNAEEASQIVGANISIVNTVLCRTVFACIPTTVTQQASICHSNCLACEIPAGY